MGAVLEWMDSAQVIVAYEGARVMDGMEVHYDGDTERQAAHRRKLVDVGRHVQTWAGRTAAPPASCSSRCGSGLCFASVASVMKELTLLQKVGFLMIVVSYPLSFLR
jgi:hypothetical protein